MATSRISSKLLSQNGTVIEKKVEKFSKYPFLDIDYFVT